jgi:hypothetical protein
MHNARVTINLLDMRSKSDHSAERVNQIFFDEPIRVLSKRSGFAHVVQDDGYQGWVDERFVRPEGSSSRSSRGRPHVIIRPMVITNRIGSSQPIPPYRLYYGTTVLMQKGQIVSPDGSFRVAPTAVRQPQRPRATDLLRRRLTVEARKFLGVPYLWGGISFAGCDCSGLVRTLFSVFGIGLPRDTKDQIKVGRQISRKSIRSGDLLFFERHVALAIGPQKFIHSSRGGGGVTINSLAQGTTDYREDLDSTFDQARRVL